LALPIRQLAFQWNTLSLLAGAAAILAAEALVECAPELG
jgi:hypothetical protein